MLCPKDSGFSWQNFVPLGEGVSLEQGRQREVPFPKIVILPLLAHVAWKRLQIGTDILLIITNNGDKLFKGVNIDDLEWSWNPNIGGFSGFFCNFWLRRRFQEWIATKRIEIDQENLRTGTRLSRVLWALLRLLVI